jgi:RNA polymerase sigma-70 factor (ECF subfamily)
MRTITNDDRRTGIWPVSASQPVAWPVLTVEQGGGMPLPAGDSAPDRSATGPDSADAVADSAAGQDGPAVAGDPGPAGGARTPVDGDAFTVEVGPHLHLLFRTALRLTHDEQTAEDLVQDTLERAFVNFARYEPGTNIRAWLLRIMSNVRISGFRRTARRPQASSIDDLEDFSLYGAVKVEGIAPADVETAVLNRIGEEAVLQAIDGLPEDFRMVVLLADVEGFAYKDMAAILDVPIGTVTSRLFRGRKQLQRTLWQHAHEAGILAASRAARPAQVTA